MPILRALASVVSGGSLPTDAKAWASQASTEISEVWNRTPIELQNVAGTNTITCDGGDVPITAVPAGSSYWLTPDNDSTDEVEININGTGLRDLLDRDGNPLEVGALLAGRTYLIVRISTALRLMDTIIGEATVPFATKFFQGFNTSINVTDASNDIDIAIGSCRDVQDTGNMILSTVLTKRSDAVWVAGTNQGGMLQSANLGGTISVIANTTVTGVGTTFTTDFTVGDVITTSGGQARRITVITSNLLMTVESAWTSTESGVTYKRGGKARNTMYRIMGICRDSDGVMDVVFTPRDIPSDLPAGYSTYRVLWHFLTDATGVNRPYTQIGFVNHIATGLQIYTGAVAGGTTNTLISTLAPKYAELLMVVAGATIGTSVIVGTNTLTAAFTSTFTRPQYITGNGISLVSTDNSTPVSAANGFYQYEPLDVNSQIYLAAVYSQAQARAATATINQAGWKWDPRLY